MLTVNLSGTLSNILVKAVVAAGAVVLIVTSAVIIATAVVVVVVAVVKEKKFLFLNHGWCCSQTWSSTKAPGICEHAGVLAPILGKSSYAVQPC